MEFNLTLILLISYLVVLIAIGLISTKKAKTSKSFFLADRSLGLFALTATITATVVGGSATIASAKLIYLNGLPSLWLDIGAATGLIILGLTLAKKVRKTKLFTLPEITGSLFDEKVRYASAILIILTQIAWISLLIQGTGAIITILLPINYTLVLTIITLIFIAYTILGGQYAVVYTDIIQFLVMIIGVCLIATPLLFLKAIPQISTISSNRLTFPINSNLGFLPILSLFFMMLMPHIVGPDIYSKILSAKNEKTAKNASLLSGIFRIIFAISIALIAISAIILQPNLSSSEAVFAMPMAINQLSPFIAGPILAAFVSVMLSSADSVLISAGTILSVDITRKKNIITSRIGILIIGLLALGLALYLNDIINTLKLAYTIFTAGLTFPIIFGFYKDKTKISSTGALISLILGGSTSLIWFFLNNPYNIDAIIIGMISSIIPLLIFREKNETKNIKKTDKK
jgi:SSS family solute:Na+ symporter